MTTRPDPIPFSRFALIALELFTLNFLWEMAQAKFYSSMKGLPLWPATYLCARAAAVDVALLVLFFAVAALVARDAAWPLHPTPKAARRWGGADPPSPVSDRFVQRDIP